MKKEQIVKYIEEREKELRVKLENVLPDSREQTDLIAKTAELQQLRHYCNYHEERPKYNFHFNSNERYGEMTANTWTEFWDEWGFQEGEYEIKIERNLY